MPARRVTNRETGSRPGGGVLGGALALLVLAVLALAVPSKAQADVLVSNFNQDASTGYDIRSAVGARFQSGGTDDLAQGFTTGTNPDGYTLTSIEMVIANNISSADIGDLTVSVHADDGSGNPAATALFELVKPASIMGIASVPGNVVRASGSHTFTVPAANTTTTFTTSTHYFVVVTYDQDGRLWYVEGVGQDPGAAAGWRITTTPLYKRGTGSWTDDPWGIPLLIRVNGTAEGVTVTNAAPTAAANTVTTDEDTAYSFEADDFGFADTDAGDTLASVKIVTLPAAGTLMIVGTAVVVDQVVTKADIDADDLTFTPVTGASGTNYASFTFKVNDGTDDSADANTMTVDVTAAMNAAPTAADKTVTTVEDTAYAFEADDFGFADTDVGNTLVSVKIVTLPPAGTLELVDTAVNVDQVVTRADIDNDNLICAELFRLRRKIS